MLDTDSKNSVPQYMDSYIFPVCRFELTSGVAEIREFFGTAFFVGSKGVFLTATHVIDDATQAVNSAGGFMGLCIRKPDGTGNMACSIQDVEPAAAPFDISVGTVEFEFPSYLILENKSVGMWREVACYGYPVTALNRSNEEFWMYGRGFRGYVHREAQSGQLPGNSHPDVLEISFAVPKGVSGGPLFIHEQSHDIAVGVCVGVNKGESTEFIFEEVTSDGSTFKEKRVRVEEYGIAHDLRPLLNWRPPNLGGLSLAEAAGR